MVGDRYAFYVQISLLLVLIQFLGAPKFYGDFYNRFCTQKSLSPQFSALNFIICLMVGFQQGHILHFFIGFLKWKFHADFYSQ